ncbi:late embryogenesis abundant protein At5g17165-like [Salvia miltiorrhiza]|uniref:late embryogenesis abundant protein At5g17165-like n=1 Tax=Salvia miltiorrhiza TaxID=226208 RepID=UPI0025ACA057|nr:late embryogenesis abundant protein At5g17165-like [Salvia miltiorrhiza]XP_057774108.1 late embryogenesis abundant protein At5g17165-like [Salvia miltiorrhiza]
MAANLQGSRLASFGKRLVGGQIRSVIPSLSIRRSVHVSVYDKNPEEHIRATLVPDDVIPPQPEHYWSPHPQTGVFGPAKDHRAERGLHVRAAADSVLEQKAFFRPLEDLDKPIHH